MFVAPIGYNFQGCKKQNISHIGLLLIWILSTSHATFNVKGHWKHQDLIYLNTYLFTKITRKKSGQHKIVTLTQSNLNLLKCNIWAESDGSTNLCPDYHKLINHAATMCPNGLIKSNFSESSHIVYNSGSQTEESHNNEACLHLPFRQQKMLRFHVEHSMQKVISAITNTNKRPDRFT